MGLVSILVLRRTAPHAGSEDPWQHHLHASQAAAVEALPNNVEVAMLKGHPMAFGYLPSAADPQQRVWLLHFDESYPFVRVVEELSDGKLTYMAADQIKIRLQPQVDVTELAPMLEALQLRLRNFNRKHHIAIVGVIDTQIDAVPRTLKAIQPWSELFVSADVDGIEFRSH